MKVTVTKKDGTLYRTFPAALKVSTTFENGQCEIHVVAEGHGYCFNAEYYTVNCEDTSREG